MDKKEGFIEKAKLIHNNVYDYSKVEYVDSKTPVCIICKKHGEFWQRPSQHLIGHGCPKCYGGVKITREEFIRKAIEKHGKKYSYEKVVYDGSNVLVEIVCPIHGSFWQLPHSHLNGAGCPHCSNNVRRTTEEFIKLAKQIHGDKYDYSKVNYVNNKTNVCIICPKHGEFWQRPEKHLMGQGCHRCGGYGRNREDFIKEAKEVHGDKYDYSKVNFVNMKTKVCIICPEHGEFWQIPQSHLAGKGCKLCSYNKTGKALAFTQEEFISMAKKTYGDKYDYTKTKYVNMRTRVIITCMEHGDFSQTPDLHLRYCGCKQCVNKQISSAETEIFEYVSQFTDAKRNVKTIIPPKEIDVYLPDYNLGIEYNGIVWHSEKYRDKLSDYSKMLDCNKNGIKLLQVYEDEWYFHKEIVLNKICHIIGKNDKKPIMARKCNIKEIFYKESDCFLEKNHIQGGVRGTVYIGLFYEDILIGVMVFKKCLKNGNEWELSRFATNINYRCPGAGGKLFKYFVRTYSPSKIKSFADRRWTINENDNFYTKCGFVKDGYTKPDYKYYKPGSVPKRIHKFNLRKQILSKKNDLPLTMTESEMAKELGYYRIWDCGLIRYVWTRQKTTANF